MAEFFPQSPNRQPDNGRTFISSLLSKLPYVDGVIETDTGNPKYELFDRLSKKYEMKVMQQSVLAGPYINQDNFASGSPSNLFSADQGYHHYIYANVDSDKIRRVSEYRRMGSFAEVSDCLDEICDEFINKDENDRVIKINFNKSSSITDEVRNEVEKEFYNFIEIYELQSRGWGYCRQFLTEGEIFFENIVHNEKKDLGVIGILNIPGELINPVYDNVQNNIVQNFVFQKPVNLKQQINPGSNPNNNINPANSLQHQIVTLESNQVTYVHSSIWNEDSTIRLPFIENCRRAYKLLSLLEDAIIIYRMVRAPERLKFVIDVGNMPPAKAEAYIKQLMQKYWSKKTYDSQGTSSPGSGSQGGVGNMYDPQSMLDSFWFAKRAGEQGSDVQVLQGGQNLGQLDDLNYFVLKLYKSLKVPTSRLNPQESFKDGAEILKEELRFAKFIVRIQSQFASGFKDAFITHLKLTGWWKEHRLHESYFNLEFIPPSNFFAIRQQQLLELKLKNFSDMSQNEGISNTYAQRHYLNMSDSSISENMEWKRKDASLRWELSQIEAAGPNWREQQEMVSSAAETSAGGETGGGSESIPEFGAAPEIPAETEAIPETPETSAPETQEQ